MPVTIKAFHVENVKRVKAVAYEPSPSGLTIIGGKNGQGKTSVLDALAWVIGGNRKAPSNAHRDGSINPPEIDVRFSNGIRAIRKGKNSDLTVIDETGKKAGQALLDAFRSEIAIDLPKFMNASGAEKAKILLGILGIGDELSKLNMEEKQLYDRRHMYGQEVDRKKKYAAELPEFSDAPTEAISALELIQQQQAILAQNGENQRKRQMVESLKIRLEGYERNIADLSEQLKRVQAERDRTLVDLNIARMSAQDIQDQSTTELEISLANIEAINSQVAANQTKAAATDEATEMQAQYDAMTASIEAIRAKRLSLLASASMPLPGLSIDDNGELAFNGKAWDCMSGAEQMRVGTAIPRALKPQCGFVFADRLEALDMDTLREFATWAESEGLQVLATRVSTGDECSIIIEDGLPQGKTYADVAFPVDESKAVSDSGETMEW